MSSVLILTAVDLEARGLARRLGLSRMVRDRWAHYRGEGVEVAAVGLRAEGLSRRSARLIAPSFVLSAGTCGALAPDLALGDLVVPAVVLTPTRVPRPTDALPGIDRAGSLLTLHLVAASPAAKARLRAETGALAVDMESALILDWAHARGIPAAVVRAVSDTAEQSLPPDLTAAVGLDGRVRRVRALAAIVRRRGALGEALALRRATRLALDAVARTLAPLLATVGVSA